MFKKFVILNIFLFLTFLLCGCGNSANENTNINNTNLNNSAEINKTSLIVEAPEKEPIETELSTFSTTIKSKGAGRLNNIRITCSKINGQTLDAGAEFSFENVVGKSLPEQGYQKADIFVNKKIVQAYGGRKLPSKYNFI